jgi:hypothetical protein
MHDRLFRDLFLCLSRVLSEITILWPSYKGQFSVLSYRLKIPGGKKGD